MNADGSNPRPLGLDMFAQATWRPDGRRLAWVEFDGRAPAIYTGPTDASSRRKLVRGSAPAWSPNARRIAFNDPDAGNPPGCGGISIANVRTGRVRQLVKGRLAEAGRCLGTPYDADWSPDGRRLVYSGVRGGASDWERALELYSVRADGTGRRRLTGNDVLDGRAEWSPDGRFIAFTRERRPGGIGELWVMRADGSRERRIAHDATGASWQPLPDR